MPGQFQKYLSARFALAEPWLKSANYPGKGLQARKQYGFVQP